MTSTTKYLQPGSHDARQKRISSWAFSQRWLLFSLVNLGRRGALANGEHCGSEPEGFGGPVRVRVPKDRKIGA